MGEPAHAADRPWLAALAGQAAGALLVAAGVRTAVQQKQLMMECYPASSDLVIVRLPGDLLAKAALSFA